MSQESLQSGSFLATAQLQLNWHVKTLSLQSWDRVSTLMSNRCEKIKRWEVIHTLMQLLTLAKQSSQARLGEGLPLDEAVAVEMTRASARLRMMVERELSMLKIVVEY